MSNNFKHHVATAIAFAFLIGWFYVIQQLGFLDYMTSIMPEKYQGSGLMLGIGFGMAPAFFIWSRFNCWVEKRLEIKGKYYEDTYYKKDENTQSDNKDLKD